MGSESRMEGKEPPSYDNSGYNPGGFTFNQYGMNPPASQYGMNPPPPQYTVNPPPPQYDQNPPPPQYGTSLEPVVVLQSPRPPQLGKDPVRTTCGNCQANITTETTTETSAVAWMSAAFLCCVCWPCAWVPLCMGSLKDVTHRCPNCKNIVGKHTARF